MGLLSFIKRKPKDASSEKDGAGSRDAIKSYVLNGKDTKNVEKSTEKKLKTAKEEIMEKVKSERNQDNKGEDEKHVVTKKTEEKLEKAKKKIMKKMKSAGSTSKKIDVKKHASSKKTDEKQKIIPKKDTSHADGSSKENEDKSKKNEKEDKKTTDDTEEKKVSACSILEKINKPRDIDVSGGTEVEKYDITADNVDATVTIYNVPTQYVPIYYVRRPIVTLGTHAILNAIREQLIMLVQVSTKEFVDPSALAVVKEKFMKKAYDLLDRYLPNMSDKEKRILAGNLIHEMLGLGDIELLLSDPYLEEIVVNGHEYPIWVYHKHYGWLKTNIFLKSEDKIYNSASSIGRRVGRQITNLNPLMDAHLSTGDRVNATLFPISTGGNTITIRKFSRSPWTIIHFLEVKTLNAEVAALLWLAIQYELNILVSGGTASGKTSMLNILMPFMPPNQRIISIEDTREINLPKFLHWVPFSSREANPEGKGQVTMLDLLANSLRMRPDRIIVGEIRRAKEAEVMFEAIRTGHSAYATFHGDKAEEVYKRLTNPPINLPESMLSALHLIVVQYRHRRKGIRRTLEIAEIVKAEQGSALNLIYQWNPRTDVLEKVNKTYRINKEIQLYTGMTDEEIERDLANKVKILEWMIKYQIKTINTVGKVFAEYYRDEDAVVKLAKSNASPKELLGDELYKEIAP